MSTVSPAVPVSEWTAFRLSREAGLSSPDSSSSPGAEFLKAILTMTLEGHEHCGTASADTLYDYIHDGIGAVVPVYTYEVWQVFMDLTLWDDEPSSTMASMTLTEIAICCLHDVADRLSHVISTQLLEDSDGRS